MEIIRKNKEIMTEVNRIAEVAGYLWTKGWAERNGGNISVNITHLADDTIKALQISVLLRIELFDDLEELGIPSV